MDRKLFEEELEREGYTVRESGMQPGEPKGQHEHDFDARLLVLDGEITIAWGDVLRTYRAGDSYSLPAGTSHDEIVGPNGVRYVVGRR